MRSASAAMQEALASGTPRLVKMLQLVLLDGTVLGFTSHDLPLEYDLGDGHGLVTYEPGGATFSNIEMTAGMEPDSFEFSGPLRPAATAKGPITTEGVLGGRFNNARATPFEVKWDDLSAGVLAYPRGDISQMRAEGSRYVAEVKNDFWRLAQVKGTQIIPSCRNEHGDEICGRAVETETLTITAAPDTLELTVTYAGDWATDYFNGGKVYPLTGVLAGTEPVEVEKWTQTAPGTAEITLFRHLAATPSVGDTLEVYRGCPRTREACMERNNTHRARAHWDVPGNNQIFSQPTPGQGS